MHISFIILPLILSYSSIRAQGTNVIELNSETLDELKSSNKPFMVMGYHTELPESMQILAEYEKGAEFVVNLGYEVNFAKINVHQ